MRVNGESRKTLIVLLGVGIALSLVAIVLWTILAKPSTSQAFAASALTSGSESAGEAQGGAFPSSDAASPRELRKALESEVVASHTAPSPDDQSEMVEVLVVNRLNGKPLANAELVYWAYTAEQEPDVDPWKWLSSGTFDAHLEHGVETATAGADGRARVKRPLHGAIVAARGGGFWGYGSFRRDDDSPWRIEVVLDASVTARVVDSRESPVGGARVVLRFGADEWFWDPVSVETSQGDGLAILPHVGYLVRNHGDGYSAVSIALGAVLDKPVEVALDLTDPPREPVRLVVPSTGACEVIVVGADGEPCAGELEIGLRQCLQDEMVDGGTLQPDRSTLQLSGIRGGRAMFRHVSPGVPLVATATRSGSNSSHSTRGLGPSAAGQTSSITVRLGETVAIVSGRVLDANGRARAKTKLRSWVEGDKESPSGTDYAWKLETDDQGRFHVDVQPRTSENGACVLVLVEVDEHNAEFVSASRPLPTNLGPGMHEVGDFTLAPSPAIISGKVVDAENTPIRNATVQVSTKHVYGDDEANFYWESLWNLRATSDAEGRFVLRGRMKVGTLAVWAEKEGSKAEPVLVACGASDVLLRMLATGQIAGQVLLDPSISKASLHVYATRMGVDSSSIMGPTQMSQCRLSDDGSFVLRGLPVGLYTVRVRDSSSWEELSTIGDVRADADDALVDSRLNPLDLRTSLAALTLTIVDSDGQPVMQGIVQATERPPNSEARVTSTSVQKGKARVTHSGHGVDLVITSTGFRDNRIDRVRDDRLVTMRRAPRVRLVLAGGQLPPARPFRLGAILTPTEEGAANRPWTDEASEFDDRGQLSTFACGAGRMIVELRVTFTPNARSTHEWGLETEVPTVIDVQDTDNEQVFEIPCDAAILAHTIEEMRKESH